MRRLWLVLLVALAALALIAWLALRRFTRPVAAPSEASRSPDVLVAPADARRS